MRMTADGLFFKTDFIMHAFFFHFAPCLFAKIALCAVQITNLYLAGKTENKRLWHFVSSGAKKKKTEIP